MNTFPARLLRCATLYVLTITGINFLILNGLDIYFSNKLEVLGGELHRLELAITSLKLKQAMEENKHPVYRSPHN